VLRDLRSCWYSLYFSHGLLAVCCNKHVHVYFDNEERPFLLDAKMRWPVEPNAFLFYVSVVKGKTRSPRTWRSYAYQFADWMAFCERAELEWRHATSLTIATYRNLLLKEVSPHTHRRLKRNTINYKLGVICQFYNFASSKGWIKVLPFDLEGARQSTRDPSGGLSSSRVRSNALPGIELRLKHVREDLLLPPRRDVRHFINGFSRWRDRLIAEIMWIGGLRRAEVCTLSRSDLPSNPSVIRKDTVAITIVGKGQKRRVVLFPTRWLRSVERYIQIERRHGMPPGNADMPLVFLGRGGKPLQPCALNRVFATNSKRTGLSITPHTLRHCYAVERLAYLQDIGAPNPLKTVQMELGHASMATTEHYLHLTDTMRLDVMEAHNAFVDRLLSVQD
jgi:integrase/recombinase XerD